MEISTAAYLSELIGNIRPVCLSIGFGIFLFSLERFSKDKNEVSVKKGVTFAVILFLIFILLPSDDTAYLFLRGK